MILLNHVVEVLDGPQFTMLGESTFLLELLDCFRVSRVAVDVDDPRRDCIRGMQCLAEETLSCLSVTSGAMRKRWSMNSTVAPVESTARYWHIQVHPLAFDLDVRLIYTPGVVRRFEFRTAALF